MSCFRKFYTYILSNYARTVFYVGVTNNLKKRVWQHKISTKGFTAKYKCFYLMYYEESRYINNAIAREKQMKHWERRWKIELIRRNNPNLEDLSKDWFD